MLAKASTSSDDLPAVGATSHRGTAGHRDVEMFATSGTPFPVHDTEPFFISKRARKDHDEIEQGPNEEKTEEEKL